MCTCFIDRREDLIIAMNFDNNGMAFELDTKNPSIFSIVTDTKMGKVPSFGINKNGIFVNNLCVDSNGKGLYKRKSKTVNLNIYLIKELLYEEIKMDNFEEYLKTMEIVNAPNICTHNFITDKKGNVYIIEPGRGNIKNGIKESEYYVMTNFSIIDFNGGKKYTDYGIDRYNKANNMLKKLEKIDVKEAFKILEKVKQEGEWNTDFSMVYSKNKKTVYYCYKSNFNEIMEYKFK